MRIIFLLKKIRTEKNMTLNELSQKSGISKSHLNYLERGEKEPTLSMLIRISLALNVVETKLYEVIK